MEKIYTVDDVSTILKIHFQTILKLLREKTLKGFKVGREWRITEQDLKEFIEKGKSE